MAGSVNKVILIGNLGKDPEIRSIQDGKKIANFSIATSESWNDRASGERKERTEWHRIVCFNDRVSDIIEKYLRKGAKVYVEGVLRTRKWTDQAGQEKYATEVHIEAFRGELTMLSDGRGAEGGGAARPAEGTSSGTSPATRGARQAAPRDGGYAAGRDGWGPGRPGADLDDEIPF